MRIQFLKISGYYTKMGSSMNNDVKEALQRFHASRHAWCII